MRKIFLIPGIFLGIFFIAIIFISRNPDQLKPLITTQFQKYTNCEINIDGHLAFSFFPFFGVKAKHIEIITPQTPALKVDIKNAVVQLKLLPFLHGKIETGTIQIDALTLNQSATLMFNNVRLKITAVDQSDHSFMTALSFGFSGDGIPLSGEANITSNVTVDINNQTASWKNIHAVVSDLTMEGELNAKNILSNPDVSAHLTLHSPNLKNILNQINVYAIKTENIPDVNDVNADINLSANYNESFSIQSNFHIKNIQTSKINLEDINARLNFKNNMLSLESINASAFGGYFNGEASISLNANTPTMTAHVKALNVQIESLFKLMQTGHTNFYSDTKISGTGNMELDVSTSGEEAKNILNNLNGTAHFNITNGLFMGKDWDDIVTKLVVSASQDFHVFRFKQLSASFKINNGIFFGDDLVVDSSEFNIKGKGQINLPNNFFDYVLQAELQNGIDNKMLATIPIKGVLVL